MAYSEEAKTTLLHHFTIEENTYETQSQKTKQQLLKSYAELKNISLENLEIKKDQKNVPRLFYRGNQQNDSISIAHHGFYCAYAIAFN